MTTRIPLIRAEEEAKLRSERLDLSIAEMGLSVRTTNCLEETGILTVRDLLHATPRRLLSISNFGEKTLDEVYAALEKLGFFRPSRKPEESDESPLAANSAIQGSNPQQVTEAV